MLPQPGTPLQAPNMSGQTLMHALYFGKDSLHLIRLDGIKHVIAKLVKGLGRVHIQVTATFDPARPATLGCTLLCRLKPKLNPE